MSFVHLQVISTYSLLQSTTRLEGLVRAAKTKGYGAIALTDYNILYGQIDFFKLCKKYEIQPIVGMQLDLSGIIQKDKAFSVVLLAKDYSGYQTLMALSTLKNREASQQEMLSLLAASKGRLIAITPGEKGEVEHFLGLRDFEKAREASLFWKNAFAEGDFYLGVQIHQKMQGLIPSLLKLSEEVAVPVVGMHDVRYLEPTDSFSCRVLKAIDANEKVDLQAEELNGTYYLPSLQEMERKYAELDLTAAAEQTQKIADRIAVTIPLQQSLLPKYPVPAGTTPQQLSAQTL